LILLQFELVVLGKLSGDIGLSSENPVAPLYFELLLLKKFSFAFLDFEVEETVGLPGPSDSSDCDLWHF